VIGLVEGREELVWDEDGTKVEANESGIATDATAGDDAPAAAVAAPAIKIVVGMEVKALETAVSTFTQSGCWINAWTILFST